MYLIKCEAPCAEVIKHLGIAEHLRSVKKHSSTRPLSNNISLVFCQPTAHARVYNFLNASSVNSKTISIKILPVENYNHKSQLNVYLITNFIRAPVSLQYLQDFLNEGPERCPGQVTYKQTKNQEDNKHDCKNEIETYKKRKKYLRHVKKSCNCCVQCCW